MAVAVGWSQAQRMQGWVWSSPSPGELGLKAVVSVWMLIIPLGSCLGCVQCPQTIDLGRNMGVFVCVCECDGINCSLSVLPKLQLIYQFPWIFFSVYIYMLQKEGCSSYVICMCLILSILTQVVGNLGKIMFRG